MAIETEALLENRGSDTVVLHRKSAAHSYKAFDVFPTKPLFSDTSERKNRIKNDENASGFTLNSTALETSGRTGQQLGNYSPAATAQSTVTTLPILPSLESTGDQLAATLRSSSSVYDSLPHGSAHDHEFAQREIVNIVAVGDERIGKTSFVQTCGTGRFPQNTKPSVLDKTVLDIDDDCYVVLWDPSGDPGMDRIRPLCYADVSVIMACFSMGSYESLDHLVSHWSYELDVHCAYVDIYIVGLQSDTPDPDITTDSVSQVQRALNARDVFYVSALRDPAMPRLVVERILLEYRQARAPPLEQPKVETNRYAGFSIPTEISEPKTPIRCPKPYILQSLGRTSSVRTAEFGPGPLYLTPKQLLSSRCSTGSTRSTVTRELSRRKSLTSLKRRMSTSLRVRRLPYDSESSFTRSSSRHRCNIM